MTQSAAKSAILSSGKSWIFYQKTKNKSSQKRIINPIKAVKYIFMLDRFGFKWSTFQKFDIIDVIMNPNKITNL